MRHTVAIDEWYGLTTQIQCGDVLLLRGEPQVIDYDQVTESTVKALETSIHVLVDGATFEMRRGLPPKAPRATGDATHAFAPPMPQGQFIKTSEPVKPGRVIN